MKTNKNILLLFMLLIVLLGNSCKKEELPPERCFSFNVVYDFPTLNDPIDSIVYTITWAAGKFKGEPARFVKYAVTSPYINGTEACGLFHYKIEVYNSKPNPDVNVIISVDNKHYLTKVVSGIGVVEGTYVYTLD